MSEETRVCNRCKNEKPLSEFYVFYRPNKKAYVRPDCRLCFNRMSSTGKMRKRYAKLTNGKVGNTQGRKAKYRYNRDEILKRARQKSYKFSKKEESALKDADLGELMEKNIGENRDKKPKKNRKRATNSKRGRTPSRKANADS